MAANIFKGYRITSARGWRTLRGQRSYHAGIDLVKSHRANIEAFTAGKVIHAGWGATGSGLGGYGNVVVIEDKNGRAHLYAHLDSVGVKKGARVKQGDVIGRQGNTGDSLGSHLHYEIRKSTKISYGWRPNRETSTLDPEKYLKDFYASEKATTTYTVKKGDNLTKIANQFNTTVGDLVKLNNIGNPNIIRVGQELKIKPAKAIKVGAKVKIKASAKTYTRSGKGVKIPSRYKGKTYTVGRIIGDDILLDEIRSWVDKKDVE